MSKEDTRQKAQEIVDEWDHSDMDHLDWFEKLKMLSDAIEQALQEAAKVDKSRCPCGGIILADTDDCKVPVCIECCIEISKSYLNMDENYNEGFKRGTEAAKVEWPSDLIKELIDNCEASTAETDISDERKAYRKDLLARAKSRLKNVGE